MPRQELAYKDEFDVREYMSAARQPAPEVLNGLERTATELLITADAGGSNSYHSRLWKTELQCSATRTGLTVAVSHFPPSRSKGQVRAGPDAHGVRP